jgi:predicted ATPase
VLDALADLNVSDPELDLRARVAVNTGEAVVALGARASHGESMVAGDVVNTASRLQSGAPVGSVVVGEETYRATRSAIDYEPAEPVTAKGKEQPVRVWIARAATTPAGERILSQAEMVGRARELDVLRGIWERVVAEERVHLVTIFGPPGIGKSRLAWEFGELVGQLGGRTLRGRSTPYGASSPYAAFSAHIKQIAGIFDSDTADAAAEKLDAAVTDLLGADEARELASHIAAFVSLPGAAEAPNRQTLFLAARRVVEQVAARQPTLFIFEDVHWADASTLDLLDELAALLHGAPVFLLAVSRPDLLTERPAWGGGLPAYTALPLEPLRGEDAQELTERLLGRPTPETVARVLEISEGNPLFIEELAASLAERSSEAAQELPTSIRALIASRLDALPAPERSLLLDAAVVGRVFWDGALVSMSDNGDVGKLLGSLERRDLIRREHISRLQGHEQFRFKHALIRDIAYQRLTRASRRSRHETVARFLEEATAGGAVAAEAIAHHWREVGDSGRAADYLMTAAEDAGRGWAKERAVALYREALELIPDGDPRRREVQLRLAVALQARYHLPDAERLRRG